MPEAIDKLPLKIYLIMPFSTTSEERTLDYWTEHFEHFIKSLILEVIDQEPLLNERFAWEIHRSSVDRGGPLNYEIVWDLLFSPIVIADITDKNPNVLYELGIRHTLTAVQELYRTIIIQDENVFSLPFDFANYSVIKYEQNRKDTWKRNIKNRLVECVQNFAYRDNPVSMTFAQHGISFKPKTGLENAQQMQAALDMVERMVALGFTVDWIQALISTQSGIPSTPPRDIAASEDVEEKL